ncbi:hypothetical protein GS597_15610 [Synechococcales cyanobacterium C]|uniref:Uncharacterized protein n=1 Tax=Petrachloros mirabilis ULC683 TaxID=2781853 RepID=A0A8K2A1R9_9CYAN|nr:hypothetical protein [Petrachloros mirabilis]NCJ07907.1 hypothetical protein [Petrachloros mirabilis ULC683]
MPQIFRNPDATARSFALCSRLSAQAELGLYLVSVNLKDLMLPGDLKRLYAQVVQARQAGLAQLERARGEAAALRNLTNAARLTQDHPGLLKLRFLQALEHSSGNTFFMGMSPTNPDEGAETL